MGEWFKDRRWLVEGVRSHTLSLFRYLEVSLFLAQKFMAELPFQTGSYLQSLGPVAQEAFESGEKKDIGRL